MAQQESKTGVKKRVLLVVPRDKIIVEPGRQRKEFKQRDLQELADSIKECSLLHPPVVEERDGVWLLRAGERRLRAIALIEGTFEYAGKEIPEGMVPVTSLKDLDEVMAAQIELAENSARINLTWQEKDAALAEVARLLELRDGVAPTSRDILEQILDEGAVIESHKTQRVEAALRRQEYADDPAVQNAKSAKDADKIIRKRLEEEQRKQKALEYAEVESKHVFIQGDCVEKIRAYEEGVFDVVCSDPIYGINMHKANAFERVKMEAGKKHSYDDSPENFDLVFDVMPTELYRVCRKEAHCYLFCDITQWSKLADVFGRAGWDVWPRPLIWYKGNVGGLARPEHGPRYTYEAIMYAIKGNKKIASPGHDVIVEVPQINGHVHPAGKPWEIYAALLKRSVYPGDKVLDFMCGSGPIFPAAESLDCTAVGIELDEKWKDICKLRLAGQE